MYEGISVNKTEMVAGTSIIALLLEKLYNGPARHSDAINKAQRAFKDEQSLLPPRDVNLVLYPHIKLKRHLGDSALQIGHSIPKVLITVQHQNFIGLPRDMGSALAPTGERYLLEARRELSDEILPESVSAVKAVRVLP